MRPLTTLDLLRQLEQQDQIVYTKQTAVLMQREHDSLVRLRRQSAGFLNAYDRLFRHLSLWLLAQGYALTTVKPHQTLLHCCQRWQPRAQVMQMIQQRHGLKHGELKPSAAAFDPTLSALLAQFCLEDSQAYQNSTAALAHGIVDTII